MATYSKADCPGSDTGSRLCIDLWEQLHSIIAARRAETLADVTVQLVTAFIVTDWMAAVADMSEREVERHLRILRRIVLSALPIVAAAGKVDLEELDADYLLGFADHEFPPVTAPPPDDRGEVGFGRAGA
jgi:hypothetical protein